MPEAFKNIETEETTETNELRGKIRFTYSNSKNLFQVSHVQVEMVYTETTFVRWTVRFRVESDSLPGIMPLLVTMGISDGEVLGLPVDQDMEVACPARPDVLARLSPELKRMDLLSDMFQAGGNALLDLDNYEQGRVQIVPAQEAATT